jgi:hypothetical protein
MWLCVYYVAARPCHHIIYTQNFINQKPKLACTSEDTYDIPEDGTQLAKPVGAAKLNNKLIRIDEFGGYS